MSQTFVRAAFYRGGSSKGVFFHRADVPEDRTALEEMLLSVLGSPDPYKRQLNGMGGGVSSLSKAAIIGPPTHPDADVDYLFAQIAVDRPVVDWGANCGNLSSVIGPFAVDEGLVSVADGEALVRIHQVNTKKIIHARFPVRDGRAVVEGDFAIAGVAGTGARIALDFLDPGGTVTSGLLPSGNVVDHVVVDGRSYAVSLVDASNPVVFVRAADCGMTGSELPDAIEANRPLMALLDAIRREGGLLMGLGADAASVGLANPKIAMVGTPSPFKTLDGQTLDETTHDIAVRMISMEQAHRAVTLTGAMCVGVAARIEGTLAEQALRPDQQGDEIRVGNPSGLVSVGARVLKRDDGWHAENATVFRTARRLMQGEVAVPQGVVR
ncbi:putative methylaconitate Delta-isomerase PrpF [Rhizobium albus]|nr:putative methylaconitate Delta-isomerase PrpF [Rhizobium albus]